MEGVTVNSGPIPRPSYISTFLAQAPFRGLLISGPQLRLFLHLLTRVSWLKQFSSPCLLYSSRTLVTKWQEHVSRAPWQWDSSSICPDLPDSHLVPFHGVKREHWEANACFASCLPHCSKWIKAWLLHLVWLVVLWPLWNLALHTSGTGPEVRKGVISLSGVIDPDYQEEEELLLHRLVRKEYIWYIDNSPRCLLVYLAQFWWKVNK